METELPPGWYAYFRGLDYEKVKAGLESLKKIGILLPSGGDIRIEYGRLDFPGGKITPVANTEFGRQHATHVREVWVWVATGEPNDNWPKYMGPWGSLKKVEVVEVKPCENGFHWIGQPFTSCDQCGLPAWEHAGMAVPAEGSNMFDAEFVLKPWKPGEADAIKQRWGR